MTWREERVDGRLLLPTPGADARNRDFDDANLQLAERLLGAGEPREVASLLLDAVVTTYGFPRGVLLGRTESRLAPLATHGVPDAAAVSGTSATVERAHEQQATQVLSSFNPVTEPLLARLLPPGADLLVLPLAADGRPLGALVLQLPTALRGRRGRRLLEEVERGATYAGLALRRVQRLAQLQRLAATDDLTMIANRRSFHASLDRELARSVRQGEPVSLVLLDLDKFKEINDLHGHPAGDEALRNVAAALTVASRDLDTAARYGGEEFAVILPECGTDQCVAIADRLRAAVRETPAVRALTASAGVATFPDHASDSEGLIRAADAALLQAKRDGRDRTVLSDRIVQSANPGSAARSNPPPRPPAREDSAQDDDTGRRPLLSQAWAPASGGRARPL
ncbi:MAG: GGDEF domain-containing protein [Rhodoferax sp.]|nr:GGDEF domain-containing protein [Actinomycetota bacterium]